MRCSQESLQRALDEVCGRLDFSEYQLEWGTRPKRLCVFVSKYDHVLWEILLRHKAGELPCDIPPSSSRTTPTSSRSPTR